jgi:hypothetical protein
MYAHFSPEHKWYYLSQQRPHEVLLLKMFDSDPDVKAKSEVFTLSCSSIRPN